MQSRYAAQSVSAEQRSVAAVTQGASGATAAWRHAPQAAFGVPPPLQVVVTQTAPQLAGSQRHAKSALLVLVYVA
jgi:hypothetical protein